MKLTELNPQFIDSSYGPVDTFEQAAGINYDCPQCKLAGKEHRITGIMFQKAVPEGSRPAWCAQGTGYEDLTFVDSPRGSRSVRHLGGHCHGHYNIHQGGIEFYPDSRGA
jgi:hypothetical protein